MGTVYQKTHTENKWEMGERYGVLPNFSCRCMYVFVFRHSLIYKALMFISMLSASPDYFC